MVAAAGVGFFSSQLRRPQNCHAGIVTKPHSEGDAMPSELLTGCMQSCCSWLIPIAPNILQSNYSTSVLREEADDLCNRGIRETAGVP
jgi:hypothetical protein